MLGPFARWEMLSGISFFPVQASGSGEPSAAVAAALSVDRLLFPAKLRLIASPPPHVGALPQKAITSTAASLRRCTHHSVVRAHVFISPLLCHPSRCTVLPLAPLPRSCHHSIVYHSAPSSWVTSCPWLSTTSPASSCWCRPSLSSSDRSAERSAAHRHNALPLLCAATHCSPPLHSPSLPPSLCSGALRTRPRARRFHRPYGQRALFAAVPSAAPPLLCLLPSPPSLTRCLCRRCALLCADRQRGDSGVRGARPPRRHVHGRALPAARRPRTSATRRQHPPSALSASLLCCAAVPDHAGGAVRVGAGR